MRVRHEVGSARQYAVIGRCPGNDMTAPSFLWPPPEVTANKFYTIDVLNNNGLSFFLEYRYVKVFRYRYFEFFVMFLSHSFQMKDLSKERLFQDPRFSSFHISK